MIEFVSKYITSNNRFYVAYSGGLDSQVLLHALVNLFKQHCEIAKLQAIHINHGWNDNAKQWEEFCLAQCKHLNVNCKIIRVDAQPQPGHSREEIARRERYAALGQCMNEGDYLLTAHHQDDQAETLMLQLLRGSGLKGLASMPTLTSFSNGFHLRPLLNFSRHELKTFAQTQGLNWIEDESNNDLTFDRNYLRQVIMPVIKQRWPSASATLARSASHCAQAQSLLENLAELDLQQAQGSVVNTLSIDYLRTLTTPRLYNLLRNWFRLQKLPIPHLSHLKRLHQDLLLSEKDAQPKISWDKVEMRRYRDNLYALHRQDLQNQKTEFSWNLTKPLILPGIGVLQAHKVHGQGIRADVFENDEAIIRFRQFGERCQPQGRIGSHPLKKLFQEWAIPPWERERIPLIYCRGDQRSPKLISVVGQCICASYNASINELGWVISLDDSTKIKL